jgi:hypothetical protein
MVKSRKMRWAGHVSRMGEKMNACRILMEKTDEKRPLRRPRSKWVDTIKRDLREIGWDGMAQDKEQRRTFANMVRKLRVS